jgi:molybdate transport system substrate-binding protein
MTRPLAVIAVAALAAITLGCDRRPAAASGGAGSSSGREVRIAAASSMKGALEELRGSFQSSHPGLTVTITYGASGNLYSQLLNKAPFDAFFSADTGYPHRLAEQGLAAPESERIYARGVLVAWVPNGSLLELDRDGLKALGAPAIKHLAIANPRRAPYGRAAEEALNAAGVYEAVKDRLVLGENVEQTAQFVQSGAAEAGLIPLSLALQPAMKSAGRYAEVPASMHTPIRHGAVITAWAASPAEAREFCDHVMGRAGRSVLARYGLVAPEQ